MKLVELSPFSSRLRQGLEARSVPYFGPLLEVRATHLKSTLQELSGSSTLEKKIGLKTEIFPQFVVTLMGSK